MKSERRHHFIAGFVLALALLGVVAWIEWRQFAHMQATETLVAHTHEVQTSLNRLLSLHVRDGADALDYLHRRGQFANRSNGEPAVVLLDLKMPKVDGLEVLRQMKERSPSEGDPRRLMTSSREEGDLLRSYELGVNAYVVKPVRFQEFVEAVKQVGSFWAVINEPPPGSLPHRERPVPKRTSEKTEDQT